MFPGRWFARMKLRAKFSFLFLLLALLITSGVLTLAYTLEREHILAEVRSRAVDLATVLAVAGVQGALADDYVPLQDLVDSIKSNEGIRHVMLLDSLGKVLVSTNTSERDSVYSDSLTQRMLKSRENLVVMHKSKDEEVMDASAAVMLGGHPVAFARVMVSLRRAEKAIRITFWRILMLGLLALAIALVSSAVLSGLVVKPIRELYQSARQIGRGAQGIEIKVTAKDEIGVLQRAMRFMVNQVKQQARMAALGLSASELSHEIRSPLTAITRYINRFVANPSEMATSELREKVLNEVNRLENLAKQLLDFARERKLQLSRTQINDLIRQAQIILSGPIEERHITVKPELEQLPVMAADKNLLLSVFINLFTNGIESMESHGTLTIQTRFLRRTASEVSDDLHLYENGAATPESVHRLSSSVAQPRIFSKVTRAMRRLRDRVLVPLEKPATVAPALVSSSREVIMIRITDTGVGIPKKDLEHIFIPFYSSKPYGHGLGLALTHRIIQDHQGVIQVESQEGKGTTFIIQFPV